jgi:excisionase family DNA binding protein
MVEWISVTEAARLSAYDADYLRKLIRGGKIKARKIITVWQINRASLLAYVKKTEKLGTKRGPKKDLTA